ncbi:MAG TPA: hypothetical protein VK524_11870, partial [Polyangiaceae bacterium]|nr:hypothetical protein [Polyangiaceae bacterium]
MTEPPPPKAPPPRRPSLPSRSSEVTSQGERASVSVPPASRASLPAPAMSENQKQAITFEALGLLDEQIQARIVHYKAELQTSPELDAITAQVVAQLRQLQASLAGDERARKPVVEIEAEQAATLSSLLARVFSNKSNFATQVIKPVGRRVAKLFFTSELHQKTKGDKAKVIQHAEQGVYYVLQRYSNRLRAELEGFEYSSAEIKELTFETLAKIERDLQVAFLSRRSPELNRVMTLFTGVLSNFLQDFLPPRIEQLAKLTVRAAKTAHQENSVGYKVLVDAFPDFRHQWERLLMEQLVNYCGDELLTQLKSLDSSVRDETVKFFTDPHVFSETGQVLCDHLYDFLC